MSKHASFARAFPIVAGLGLIAAAAPAVASPKAPKITVPASVFKDATSKLCMPSSTLGPKADPALPKTLCQTRDEWTAMGVTIVVK